MRWLKVSTICALAAAGTTVLAQNLILKTNTGSIIQTVPIEQNSTVVFRDDGSLEVTCADVALCTAGSVDAPEISLSLNPSNPQTPNSNIAVNWSIANPITSCNPTDDAASPTAWEASGAITTATGSRTVSITDQPITFSLSCTGVGGSDNASVTATFENDGGPTPDNFEIPAACQNLQPANTSWGRVDVWDGSVIQVNAERFYDIFDEQFNCTSGNEANCVWPGAQGTKAQIVVRRSEYAALKFIASSGADSGSIVFEDGSFGGSSPRIISIAECPGQFTGLPVGCSQAVLAGRLRWRNSNANFGECELQPGGIYYLNIINAEAATPSVPACPTSSCANLTEVGG